jgi:uncharacterized cupredoxin-like copper-binding protein
VRRFAILALAVLCVGLGVIQAAAGAGAKSVTVTAGKPSEFKFKLSTSSVALGTVKFTVTNGGQIVHDFKVCSTTSAKATKNTCNGKGTKKLSPKGKTTLAVTFKKKGTYEYLCTVPGHAAAGMKGIIKVV